MSFVVRQVSRTADGREIVRPRRHDAPTLSVGRGTDCDVHLPDLAATLHHVTITQTGSATIAVDEAAGLQFQVGPRNVRHATIDARVGGTIRIGAHQIVVGHAAEGEADAGAIILTVERVGALSEASDEVDEARAFSLAGVAPSKRGAAWALAIAVLLAFLAWPIWTFSHTPLPRPTPAAANAGLPVFAERAAFHADESWSPGPLSAAHANLQNNCKACHQQPFVAVRDDSCIACHTQVHNHAAPGRLALAKAPPGGFARFQLAVAGAFNIPQGRCVECHTEHEGAQHMPVTQQKFCTDCHASLDQRLKDTRIENSADFGTAHAQFKPAVLIAWNGPQPVFRRVSLDANPMERSGLKFPHKLHLSGTNSVARMAQTLGANYGFGTGLQCKDCHVANADGVSFRKVDMEGQCGMCHSLAFASRDGVTRTLRHGTPREVIAELRDFYAVNGPARPQAMDGVSRRRPGDFAADRTAFNYTAAVRGGGRAASAIRAVFSPGGACYDCHTISDPGGGVNYQVAPVFLQQRYEKKGWFDHAAHRTETCASCHAANASNSSADVLLPKIASCRACHGGESARHAQVPSACAMCHDYHVGDGAPQQIRTHRGGRDGKGYRPDDGPAHDQDGPRGRTDAIALAQPAGRPQRRSE